MKILYSTITLPLSDIDSDSIGSGSGLSERSVILQRGHELQQKLKKQGENKYQLYSYFT